MRVSPEPVFLDVGSTPANKRLVNEGPGTVYYKETQPSREDLVETYDDSIAPGDQVDISTGKWVRTNSGQLASLQLVDLGPIALGYIPTTALGSTVPTLVDGKVPSSQLPAGDAARPAIVPFSIPGEIAVGAGTSRLYMQTAGTIQTVEASLGTGPTGQSAIFDVNKNGTTIFTSQGARPTINAAGHTSGRATPAVTTFAAGDYFTVDVDQVGVQPAAAITHVATESTGNTASATSHSVTRVAGATTGDYQIVKLFCSTSLAWDATATGWTAIGTVKNATGISVMFFGRVDNGDAGPWNFTWTTPVTVSSTRSLYRGVDTSTPAEASAFVTNNSATTFTTGASLTTLTDNALEYIHLTTAASRAVAAPAGYTARLNFDNSTASSRQIADKVFATAGATAHPTVSWSGSSAAILARISLKPATAEDVDVPGGADATVVMRYLESS